MGHRWRWAVLALGTAGALAGIIYAALAITADTSAAPADPPAAADPGAVVQRPAPRSAPIVPWPIAAAWAPPGAAAPSPLTAAEMVELAATCGVTVQTPAAQAGWGTARVTALTEDSCRLLRVAVTPAPDYCFAAESLTPLAPPPTTCSPETDWTVLRWADLTFTVYFTPTTFHYDTFDATGAVSAAGSYAFLAADAATEGDAALAAGGDPALPVVTTYEAVREAEGVLRLHRTDAEGSSRAAFYATVAVGDLLEWRVADDCFVRYTVTAAPVPAADATVREFGVAPLTYAFTGCSGALPPPAAASAAGGDPPAADPVAADVAFGALPPLGGTDLPVPIIHGPFQIVPAGWTGATKAFEPGERLVRDESVTPSYTTSLTEARTFPFWREPTVPAGMRFRKAETGEIVHASHGYEASWETAEGYGGFRVRVWPAGGRYHDYDAAWHNGAYVHETRIIAGRPALVDYAPYGDVSILVRVYDAADEVIYTVQGSHSSLRSDPAEVIAIARSLFE